MQIFPLVNSRTVKYNYRNKKTVNRPDHVVLTNLAHSDSKMNLKSMPNVNIAHFGILQARPFDKLSQTASQ